jgi:hypothetical protein
MKMSVLVISTGFADKTLLGDEGGELAQQEHTANHLKGLQG